MNRAARTTAQVVLAGSLLLLASILLGGTAAAATLTTTVSSTDTFTSEDMARSSGSMSKYLWIAAPFVVAALWFGFNRLWSTPAKRR